MSLKRKRSTDPEVLKAVKRSKYSVRGDGYRDSKEGFKEMRAGDFNTEPLLEREGNSYEVVKGIRAEVDKKKEARAAVTKVGANGLMIGVQALGSAGPAGAILVGVALVALVAITIHAKMEENARIHRALKDENNSELGKSEKPDGTPLGTNEKPGSELGKADHNDAVRDSLGSSTPKQSGDSARESSAAELASSSANGRLTQPGTTAGNASTAKKATGRRAAPTL